MPETATAATRPFAPLAMVRQAEDCKWRAKPQRGSEFYKHKSPRKIYEHSGWFNLKAKRSSQGGQPQNVTLTSLFFN